MKYFEIQLISACAVFGPVRVAFKCQKKRTHITQRLARV